MTTIELHPEFLTKNGVKQFAVLTYQEYVALQEWLEDAEDLLDLRTAQKEEANAPTISLSEMEKEFKIT
jgi:alanine racemase